MAAFGNMLPQNRVSPAAPKAPAPMAGTAPAPQAPTNGPQHSAAPVSAIAPPPVAPPAPAPVAAPSAPVSPVSSAPPGSATSSFGPGSDLLSTQINPNMPVNRTQLAQNSVKDWEAQNAPVYAAEQRSIGQNAAKFGRIGAGMTTNDLTGLDATHQRDRQMFQNQLASGLADATVGDARNANDQLRTERDYQTGRNDKAQQDRINQTVLGDQLLNSSFGRAQARTQAGYGNSPVDTLSGFSGALGQSADASTAAGVNLMSGANKPPAPVDWASILRQAQGAGGTAAPASPTRTVRNF